MKYNYVIELFDALPDGFKTYMNVLGLTHMIVPWWEIYSDRRCASWLSADEEETNVFINWLKQEGKLDIPGYPYDESLEIW